MDIQAEKLSLIKWLAETNDIRVIEELKKLRLATAEKISETINAAEKKAIDLGLKEIKEGKTKSHQDVEALTKNKYPNLFKAQK